MTTDAERIARAWMTAPFLNDDEARAALLSLPAAASATIDSSPSDTPSVSVSSDAAGGEVVIRTKTTGCTYRKEIVYDRETRDYGMYLDGELVGFARTYHEAEVTLDQLVFDLISGQYFQKAR